MTRNFIVLMNHDLTQRQLSEVNTVFGLVQLVVPPDEIRTFWENISPEGELEKIDLNRVVEFLQKAACTGDFVLVQGEFGAVFYIVDYCFKKGLIPVYSTSKRNYNENKHINGSIERRHIFRHVCFRKYIRWRN